MMTKNTFLTTVFFLALAAGVAYAEVPREIRGLYTLDKIVEDNELPSDTKYYVLAIFKACCTPNEQAIDWMSNTFQQKPDSIAFVGLNVDRPRHFSKVKNWLFSREVKFTVYSDPSGQKATALKTFSPPSIIIFDNTGKEIYRTLGFRPNDRKKLNEVLGLE